MSASIMSKMADICLFIPTQLQLRHSLLNIIWFMSEKNKSWCKKQSQKLQKQNVVTTQWNKMSVGNTKCQNDIAMMCK